MSSRGRDNLPLSLVGDTASGEDESITTGSVAAAGLGKPEG